MQLTTHQLAFTMVLLLLLLLLCVCVCVSKLKSVNANLGLRRADLNCQSAPIRESESCRKVASIDGVRFVRSIKQHSSESSVLHVTTTRVNYTCVLFGWWGLNRPGGWAMANGRSLTFSGRRANAKIVKLTEGRIGVEGVS